MKLRIGRRAGAQWQSADPLKDPFVPELVKVEPGIGSIFHENPVGLSSRRNAPKAPRARASRAANWPAPGGLKVD